MLWVSSQALMTHTCRVDIPDVPCHPQGSVQSNPPPSTPSLACALALTRYFPLYGRFAYPLPLLKVPALPSRSSSALAYLGLLLPTLFL